MTDWAARVGWVVGLGLFVALVYWLMREGWKWRSTLQGDLPELPTAPHEPGPAKLTMSGRYHGSTTAGQWLDRIVAHGLGTRSRVELTLTDAGTGRQYAPARTTSASPSPHCARPGSTRASPARVLTEGGLLVVTWEHGDKMIDSGSRSDHAAEHSRWVETLNEHDQQDGNGRRTMTTSTRGAGKAPAVLVLEDGRIFAAVPTGPWGPRSAKPCSPPA